MSNYAYVTLVTKDSYLEGAHYLHHSLKRAHSKYPLIIMITENIEHLVDEQSTEYNYRIIPYYRFECNTNSVNKECINKLYAFNFTEFDKIFFLDADNIVFENIDFIFDEGQQYEFLAGLGAWDNNAPSDTNWRVLGQCFLLTPEKNKFYKFLAEYDKQEIFSDEKAFALYFYPNYYNEFTEDKIEIMGKLYKKMHHDGGLLKYWTILTTTEYKKYFNDFTEQEIHDYFKCYSAFKRFSYYYTSRAWEKE